MRHGSRPSPGGGGYRHRNRDGRRYPKLHGAGTGNRRRTDRGLRHLWTGHHPLPGPGRQGPPQGNDGHRDPDEKAERATPINPATATRLPALAGPPDSPYAGAQSPGTTVSFRGLQGPCHQASPSQTSTKDSHHDGRNSASRRGRSRGYPSPDPPPNDRHRCRKAEHHREGQPGAPNLDPGV